jgi:hypothetical protein
MTTEKYRCEASHRYDNCDGISLQMFFFPQQQSTKGHDCYYAQARHKGRHTH